MLHVIANPASHSGTGAGRIKKLTRQLEKEHLDFCLHMTTGKGNAGTIVSTLSLTSEDQLLLSGGDGSMNELISGLSLPCPADVLLFPSGSGNDFARGMKISKELEDLIPFLDRQAAVPSRNIDLGQVTSFPSKESSSHALKDKRFCVSCGFGMDAATCDALETGKLKSICNRLHIGKLSYLIVGIRTILQTGKDKRAAVKVTADGKTVRFRNTVFLSVHNLPYEGGGFPFAPEASPEDGILDVCVIHVPSRFLMLPMLAACLLGGRHTAFRHFCTSIRCKTITVSSDRPMPLHTDGEVVRDQMGFTAAVLPGVLKCRQ
ncbi:MAG: diacylglycerol kinase family protein [Lachnospiraceae bacterium]|nr:diacylglycerol kinase family protein [Lachnospiraceae bacterium]